MDIGILNGNYDFRLSAWHWNQHHADATPEVNRRSGDTPDNHHYSNVTLVALVPEKRPHGEAGTAANYDPNDAPLLEGKSTTLTENSDPRTTLIVNGSAITSNCVASQGTSTNINQ